MATATRNDVHSPGSPSFDPAHYEVIAGFYQGGSSDAQNAYTDVYDEAACDYALGVERDFADRFLKDIEGTPWFADAPYPTFDGNYAKKGTCDHCGAGFAYGVLFLHKPSEELVHIGHICAGNAFSLPNRIALLKKKAEDAIRSARELAKRKESVAKWCADNPEAAATLDRLNDAVNAKDPDAPDGWNARVLNELAGKLNHYGSLSAAQTGLILRIEASHNERLLKAIEEDRKIKLPLPEGLKVIEGKIISFKEEEDRFSYTGGTITKVLVEHADGWRVYGTCPRALLEGHPLYKLGGTYDDVKKTFIGATIQFNVSKVEPSNRDATFGFFTRPTAPKVLQVING